MSFRAALERELEFLQAPAVVSLHIRHSDERPAALALAEGSAVLGQVGVTDHTVAGAAAKQQRIGRKVDFARFPDGIA